MILVSSRTAAAVLCLMVLATCGRQEEPLMDVHQLMGNSPEQLKDRLGPADDELVETASRFGFLRWNRLEGVRLLIMVKGGKAVYVTYGFRDMAAFDEEQALAQTGIERPEKEPTPIELSKAVRWEEYEGYGRLTINPETKLVSVGRVPVYEGDPPADTEAAAEERPELGPR